MIIMGAISATCGDPGLAAILTIIKRFMNILWIVGPILSFIGIGFAFIRLMTNPEEKKYKNLLKNSGIALLILFLLPAIVNTVMKVLDDTFEFTACWNYAETINSTGSNNSHYIDKNKRPKTQVNPDPSDYKSGK